MTWDELFGCPGPDRDYDDAVLGPVQKADALALAAVLNYLRPEVAVEYGSLEGHSAAVICRFCKTLYSVDADGARSGVCHVVDRNPNVIHVHSCMTAWTPPVPRVDFVYFDASHVYADSFAAFHKIFPFLSQEATLAVHDTGAWPPGSFPLYPKEERDKVVADERAFCESLVLMGWNRICLGSRDLLRHGLTFLQRPHWK